MDRFHPAITVGGGTAGRQGEFQEGERGHRFARRHGGLMGRCARGLKSECPAAVNRAPLRDSPGQLYPGWSVKIREGRPPKGGRRDSWHND